MALPLYLAQTQGEMSENPLPGMAAYMACHFSPWGDGLSNLPRTLPPGTMLILDDSSPIDGHNPEKIAKQLSEVIQRNGCDCVLLDFQRPDIAAQQELAGFLSGALPCPVGVSEFYAQNLSCPVFLSPVPPDRLLSDYISPWQGQEIWLEAAMEGRILTLTAAGCRIRPLPDFPADGLSDEKLCCHYTVETTADSATFHLWRTGADLDAILKTAESCGITKAIGLWQELGSNPTFLQKRRKEPQNTLPDS